LHVEIEEAENGVKGLEITSSRHFDLIITDVEMPGMDGFELCKTLKLAEQTKRIPVIILSSLESDNDIEKGFLVGAAAYIRKSNGQRDLIPCVNKILGKHAIRGKRALIVDDSKFILNVLSEGLTQTGLQVSRARNGQEALAVMQKETPHIILSDVNMPVMDGREFHHTICRDKRFADTPFIAMSGNSERRVLLEMMGEGASAYLIKPFEVEELVLLTEKLLSDHWKTMADQRQALIRERDLLLSSISSLISALEARDSYTRSHSENVARLSKGLAKRMLLPTEDVERIELAAKLHDVGKIGIRDNILLKKGQLSEEEYATIRQHPLKGVGILKPIPSMDKILNGVLHHHEKMDGTGYPLRLRGNEIPLDARIIAVADVYDALTSDRPYRRGMNRNKAMGMICNMRGPHLCPNCVDHFEDMMAENIAAGAHIPVVAANMN